jgi:hypothetical protein
MTRNFSVFCLAAVAAAAGFWLGRITTVEAESKRVFEIRTYTAHEGKLQALHARFRNHTCKIFERHGMTNIGYWQPADPPLSNDTLIYILAHPSREAAKKAWDAFRADTEWQKVRSESEAAGPIVKKVESVFLDAVDYSPLK